jgi:hypothetical protein
VTGEIHAEEGLVEGESNGVKGVGVLPQAVEKDESRRWRTPPQDAHHTALRR